MKRFPVLSALAAQLVTAAVLLALAIIVKRMFGLIVPVPALLLLQGVAAAFLGERLGLAPWWRIINVVLPFAVWGAWVLELPAWVYLVALLGLLAFFWNSADERVPLYLSNTATREALATLLPAQTGVRFLDIGAGLSGTLAHLARMRPDGYFAGVESAPVPALISRLRLMGVANARLIYGDLWRQELASYDVVYCFLSPAPMAEVYRKAKAEMRRGSVLISNSFAVPQVAPDEVYELEDRRRTRLYLYRL
ncbi:MAG: class I SAM-dependent methyltransferase [Pseudomonadota bacterium]